MNKETIFTITPSELNVEHLYEYLIHNCNYFDVVMLALMLNQSKELIAELKKEGGSNE